MAALHAAEPLTTNTVRDYRYKILPINIVHHNATNDNGNANNTNDNNVIDGYVLM